MSKEVSPWKLQLYWYTSCIFLFLFKNTFHYNSSSFFVPNGILLGPSLGWLDKPRYVWTPAVDTAGGTFQKSRQKIDFSWNCLISSSEHVQTCLDFLAMHPLRLGWHFLSEYVQNTIESSAVKETTQKSKLARQVIGIPGISGNKKVFTKKGLILKCTLQIYVWFYQMKKMGRKSTVVRDTWTKAWGHRNVIFLRISIQPCSCSIEFTNEMKIQKQIVRFLVNFNFTLKVMGHCIFETFACFGSEELNKSLLYKTATDYTF